MWHHSVAKNDQYEGDFNHFVECLFLPGECESGSYFEFVLPYCKAAHRWERNAVADIPQPFTQVSTLWYEQMTHHPIRVIMELAAFLNISVTAERAALICEECNFSNMKELEKKHGTGLSTKTLTSDLENDGDKEKSSRNHIRKGGIGGWRNYLSEAQSEKIDYLLQFQCQEYDLDVSIDWG